LAGLSCPVKKLVPLWHCEQSPVDGCDASATLNVQATARGLVWKPVYCAPVVLTVGAIGYAFTPIHTKLASWHDEQPLVTPAWICAVVGAGVAKAVPGAVAVAVAAISPEGTVARWQLSQVVLDGMCDVGPTGEVAGMTTIFVTPTNVEPVIAGPWQAAQLLVMPLWLIFEPVNFAPLPTGVATMLEPAPT